MVNLPVIDRTIWFGTDAKADLNPLFEGFVITGGTNYYTTAATFDSSSKIITYNRNDTLSAYSVSLSALSTTNYYTTGATLNTSTDTIYFNRNDILSAYSINLSGVSSVPFGIDSDVSSSAITATLNKQIVLQNDTVILVRVAADKDFDAMLNANGTGNIPIYTPFPINGQISENNEYYFQYIINNPLTTVDNWILLNPTQIINTFVPYGNDVSTTVNTISALGIYDSFNLIDGNTFTVDVYSSITSSIVTMNILGLYETYLPILLSNGDRVKPGQILKDNRYLFQYNSNIGSGATSETYILLNPSFPDISDIQHNQTETLTGTDKKTVIYSALLSKGTFTASDIFKYFCHIGATDNPNSKTVNFYISASPTDFLRGSLISSKDMAENCLMLPFENYITFKKSLTVEQTTDLTIYQPINLTVDFTIDQYFIITGLLSNIADTIYLYDFGGQIFR